MLTLMGRRRLRRGLRFLFWPVTSRLARLHRLAADSFHGVSVAILHPRSSDTCSVVEIGVGGKRQMAPIARTLRPNMAVVASIASEHSRSLLTIETTRHEKAHMVRCLPAAGVAVLSGDDPNALWMAGQRRARVVTFGFSAAK